MPLMFSLVDDSEPLVDSPLSPPTSSTAPEPEPEPPATECGLFQKLLTSQDIRSCILCHLSCFDLVRLRRVSVEVEQYAAASLQTLVTHLGARTAAEWLAEHPGAPVTHSTLSRLLALCPGATSIDLAPFGRGAVTDEMLGVVARHCSLDVLLAAGPGEITDTGVLQLCRQRGCCATLRRVVLSENFSVGDAAVEALTLAAPNLAEVEAEATGLSDVGLMALAKSRQLQLLNAGYCRGVSDFGVRQLTACSGLVALNLTACAVFDPHPLSFRRHCCFAMKTCGVITDTS